MQEFGNFCTYMPIPLKQTSWRKSSILLIHGGALPQQAFDASASGQSLMWILQDPRFVRKYVQLQTPHTPEQVMEILLTTALNVLRSKQADAVIWLRDDVIVSDFLLADRVSELQEQGSWLLKDYDGKPFCAVLKFSDVMPSNPCETLSWSIAPNHAPPTSSHRQQAPELLIVSASRMSAKHFYESTALGRSVQRLRQHGVNLRLHIRCDNAQPLAIAYNQAISTAFAESIVIFAHDDIDLHDWHLAHRLDQALQSFDVVGVAGSQHDQPEQPGWAFPKQKGTWAPATNLLGCIGHDTRHRTGPGRKIKILSRYGQPTGSAALLDGVFLAVRMRQLLATGLRFDPAFAFHFYDLDFCRSARSLGLKLGVWPIALTHLSGGNFDDATWSRTCQRYHDKWRDKTPTSPHTSSP